MPALQPADAAQKLTLPLPKEEIVVMSTVIPAIRGKLGNTEFYETTMKVQDLVHAVRPPRENDDWANFSIEERMQRDPDRKRILNQLAPYIAKNADRFFGSIIVLVYNGEVIFEPITDFQPKVPAAYRQNAQRLGFLSINGGTQIVLDGQHRLLALRMVQQGEIKGPAADNVNDDEVCVIFISHENNVKTRRIFNTVNRYAKQTSRGDNIVTSEDDGYAIVARHLLRDDAPLHSRDDTNGKREEIVDWRSNTLTKRSVKLTTISAVYESVRLILETRQVDKLNPQDRPSDDELETYIGYAAEVWEALLEGMASYQRALNHLREIPDMRKDEAKTALLFKPASQIGLIDGLLRAADNGSLTLAEAVARANRIPNWSMTADLWRGVIIKGGGAIDAGPEARRRMADLICYLIAADHLSPKLRYETWRAFNNARNHPVDVWLAADGGTESKPEDLPAPVEGEAFTSADALAYFNDHGLQVAA
jgi:DNA sulfur modification protein DndB